MGGRRQRSRRVRSEAHAERKVDGLLALRVAAPARARPQLAAYLQRMLARLTVQRVLANEGLQPPFV
jgi:hypothetical protein